MCHSECFCWNLVSHHETTSYYGCCICIQIRVTSKTHTQRSSAANNSQVDFHLTLFVLYFCLCLFTSNSHCTCTTHRDLWTLIKLHFYSNLQWRSLMKISLFTQCGGLCRKGGGLDISSCCPQIRVHLFFFSFFTANTAVLNFTYKTLMHSSIYIQDDLGTIVCPFIWF